MNKLNTIIIILLSFVLLSPVFTTTSYAYVTTDFISDFELTTDSQSNEFYAQSLNKVALTSSELQLVDDFLSAVSFDSNYDTTKYKYFIIEKSFEDGSPSEYYVYRFSLAQTFDPMRSSYSSSGGYTSIYFRTPTYPVYGKIEYVDGEIQVPTLKSFANYKDFYFGYVLNSDRTNFVLDKIWNVTTFTYNESILYFSQGELGVIGSGTYFSNPSTTVVNINNFKLNAEGSTTPTFPTNAEIASAVQKFYNSDIYKNNTNFKDFIVVYSALKNTYAFIGTDNHILQEIFYDGVQVPGVDFSSSDTWWRFNSKFGDIQSFLFGNKFYLYFIEGDSDVITNEGTGTLYDLFRSRYSMNMTIVYSTYDYDVIEYRPPLEGETDNQVTSGTIQGDSYTYDENLDPTDNEYSPLQNYVPSDPTQSILNDVDFDSINQAFEDGKVILNIENASWIFTANNQLVEYFLGFISFLIVLIAISRVLGG